MTNTPNAPVLVVGATGLLGTEVCRHLIEKGRNVRALVRPTSDPGKVSLLRNLGVKTVTGDLKDPDSIGVACRGAGAVISTASSTLSRQEGDSIGTVDGEGQLQLVEAAEAAGVKQFVFISFPGVPEPNPLQDAKRAVEMRLRKGNMTFSVLQPTLFMEVWLSPALGFDFPNGQATVYGDGRQKISWIAVRDVAGFAVAALENPAARNTTIPLGGPDMLSPLEAIALFEEQSGSKFMINHIPVDALQAQYEGAADPLQKSFAALMLSYAGGVEIEMESTRQQFGLQMTSVQEYAQQMLPVRSAIV
jgi:uncharacterized protein YbjT (DUF2867 family)